MRILILFFVSVFLFASCNSIHPFRSNYKFKTVKAKSIDATANLKSESVATVNTTAEVVPVILENQEPIDSIETHNQITILTFETQEKPTENTIKSSQKPTTQLNEEDQEKIKELAIEAEDRGWISRNLGIAGFILSFIPILGILGLIMSILSLSIGIKGLRSKYITENGLRWARSGVILSSITIGLWIIVISLFILFIFIL